MPTLYYKYNFRKVGYYYAGASAGIGFLHYKFENNQKVKKKELEYQATLLGLTIGNRFTVVTEIGYGCKGIFQLGFYDYRWSYNIRLVYLSTSVQYLFNGSSAFISSLNLS